MGIMIKAKVFLAVVYFITGDQYVAKTYVMDNMEQCGAYVVGWVARNPDGKARCLETEVNLQVPE